MQIPTTAAQVILVIVVALPGVVYATTRIRARGIRATDVSLSSRISQGVVAGVVLDSVYLVILGDRLVGSFLLVDNRLPSVRAAASFTLVLGVLVPAASAWLLHTRLRWSPPPSGWLAVVADKFQRVRSTAREQITKRFGSAEVARRYSQTPTAWDYAAPVKGRRFVRIETAEGKFLGGWFAEDSFISTYPEGHDIYVELQYRMGTTGEFLGRVPGTDGFWYSLRPGDTMDWIDPAALGPPAGGTDEQ